MTAIIVSRFIRQPLVDGGGYFPSSTNQVCNPTELPQLIDKTIIGCRLNLEIILILVENYAITGFHRGLGLTDIYSIAD
jgi:hypothetical protein